MCFFSYEIGALVFCRIPGFSFPKIRPVCSCPFVAGGSLLVAMDDVRNVSSRSLALFLTKIKDDNGALLVYNIVGVPFIFDLDSLLRIISRRAIGRRAVRRIH